MRDKDRIEHILQHYDEMLLLKHKYDFEEHNEIDRLAYKKAIRMDLLQMGELVNHLSNETLIKLNPEDVKGVVDIRNFVAHGYTKLKDDYIEDTITIYCPKLIEQLKEIILVENSNNK